MNSSTVTPDQSRPWKNSILNLPKKPSHLALSGLHPFLDIDLNRPFSLQILIQPRQRQWPPLSGCTVGWSPSSSRPRASVRDEFAISASGEVDIDQLGGMPSKQPTMGGRYTLPAGMRNSVTSVIHSPLGLSAPKRCLPSSSRSRFGGASDVFDSLEVAGLSVGKFRA